MNEGLNVFVRLTLQQREARLQRCGLNAAMTPSGRAQLEQPGTSGTGANPQLPYISGQNNRVHRQQYIVSVFNLQVVDIQALGTGQAMRQKVKAQRPGGQALLSEVEQGHSRSRGRELEGRRSGALGAGAGRDVGSIIVGGENAGRGAGRAAVVGGVAGNVAGSVRADGENAGRGAGRVEIAGGVAGNVAGSVRAGGGSAGLGAGRAAVVGGGTGNVAGSIKTGGENAGRGAGRVEIAGGVAGNAAGSVRAGGENAGRGVGRAAVVGGGAGNAVGGSSSFIRSVRAANSYTGGIADGSQSLPTNRRNLAAYIGLEEQSGGRVVLAGAEAESGEPFVVGGGLEMSGTDRGSDNYGLHHRRGTAGQLREAAVRALYCLGLDSGEVLLTALGGRQFAVEDVIPLSAAGTESIYQAAEALNAALALEQPGRPGLLMGMDPEFLILRESTGRVVPASRYLPLDGAAGCDAGPPGTQGTFPVAELRPQPRGEPRALLAQLMSAVRAADRLIADRSLRWRAGGMPLPGWALGGHLHFSGVTLTAPLLRALDNYLALPLMLLEDARAAARRPRYGVLGDFRIQPHGGFEYRTLPSFLVSPVIAKGAVFLAHLIVSRYEDLTLRPLDREDLHAAYYSGDKPPLRAAFIPLQAQLRELPGYAQAAAYIEPLLGYIAAERTWDESRDIRGLWRS